MGFFDVPPPPEPPPPPETEPEGPEWFGPPGNVLGAPISDIVVLHRSERLAVAVVGLTAFPTGTMFSLLTKARAGLDLDELDMDPPWMRRQYGRRGSADDAFRFGVAFADGRKATTLGDPFHRGGATPEADSDIVLIERGGEGGSHTWNQGYWLWPLPPPGQLQFVCEWPARGLPETRATMDAGQLISAAAHAITLWDREPGRGDDGVHMSRADLRVSRGNPPSDAEQA